MNRARLIPLVFLVFPALLAAATAQAIPPAAPLQTLDAAHLDTIASLPGTWRFSQSDDPSFANPSFDDSAWPLLTPDQPLAAAHLPARPVAYTWARIHLRILNPGRPLAIGLTTRSARQYTVFADGRPLASTPSMAKRLGEYTSPFAIPLPPPPHPGQPQDILLAVRFLTAPTAFPPTPNFPVRQLQIGPLPLLTETLRDQRIRTFDREFVSTLAVSCLFLVFAPIGFALFLTQRRQTEYLWVGVGSLLLVAYFTVDLALRFGLIPYTPFHILAWRYCAWIALLCDLAFVVTLSSYRHRPLYPAYAVLLIGPLFGFFGSNRSFGVVLVIVLSFLLVAVPLLLARGFRRGQFESGLLLPFFTLFLLATLLQQAAIFFPELPALPAIPYPGHPARVQLGYLGFDLQDLGLLLMVLGLFTVVIYRFLRVSQDQQRAAAELEAARTIQQVLIPESLPSIPDLTIDSVYQPAQQVGGDFFQIIPLSRPQSAQPSPAQPSSSQLGLSQPDPAQPGLPPPTPPQPHGVLILLGDVSGKGLPAAMTVAVLVGAIRTFAESLHSPAALLAGLNRRLLRRDAGFTTCIALHIDPSHRVTAASAGHLQPYLNGAELPLDPGLPLGLAPDATYAEFTFTLGPGEILTLLTDGVVEASAASSRELFGFARTEAISTQSAHAIAAAACSFAAGAPQADDITVLTITAA